LFANVVGGVVILQLFALLKAPKTTHLIELLTLHFIVFHVSLLFLVIVLQLLFDLA
jgi:F0F1-type ATP synthase membrane subunit a